MDEEKGFSKSSALTALAVVAFLALSCFAIFNSSDDSSKKSFYSEKHFYKGQVGEKTNWKAVYSEMNKNTVLSSSACLSEMQVSANAMSVGGLDAVWVVDGVEYDPTEYAEKTYCKPFKDCREGTYILAPVNPTTFLNSNIQSYDDGKQRIEIMVGEYVIVFEDIETWWCHIKRNGIQQHTTKCGFGGVYKQSVKGAIIGSAKSDTVMRMFKVSGDSRVECKIGEYFGDPTEETSEELTPTT